MISEKSDLLITKMFLKIILVTAIIMCTNCEKQKTPPFRLVDTSNHRNPSSKTTSTTTELSSILEILETVSIPKVLKEKKVNKSMLTPGRVRKWAGEIKEKLFYVEEKIVGRNVLKESFMDIKVGTRDGAAIIEKSAAALEDLLKRRIEAAEAIGRQAEIEAINKTKPPSSYIFDNSIKLNEVKKLPDLGDWELPNNCSSTRRVPLKYLTHFGNGSQVELDITSVKVAAEVFDCNPSVLQHIFWSEELLHIFQQNYAQDAMTDFQYFCSAKGFLRHYPAALWQSMFNLQLSEDIADVYDCRLRPWYVSAEGAPKDILILFDGSGSMVNSTNKLHAEQFTSALLNALTDDDQVNVLQFNIIVKSPIDCFNGKLVPANHVNSAALMAALKQYESKNITDIDLVLEEAIRVMHREAARVNKPRSCQQAIVLLADSIQALDNYTRIMQRDDPSGEIRLFVIWLHDAFGLRDDSRINSGWLACNRDGYYAELITDSDVTEQVMQILRVMERPLVHQRKERIRVFSDVYAHVEDPRRSEYYWETKERAEQAYRYWQLRRDKQKLLSKDSMYKYHMYQQSLNMHGHYYEGVDLDYRFQISVSVPVFEDTTEENITIVLEEEKQRNSTRTYPVNRLLGVAGVDIPIDNLRLILPYYELGALGSLFIIDHRGNIVLHDNTKPVFDGDILKPGYRTVDFLDLEQSALNHSSRNYSADWLNFRKAIVNDDPQGNRTMFAKTIYENGMRVMLDDKEYHWKRVMESYTVVVSLPKYNKRRAVPDGAFTQQLAKQAIMKMIWPYHEYTVHPTWLYCKHVDQHFTEPEFEVRHFIARRSEEPNFKMQYLNQRFSPIRPTLFQKTYLCNEELIARLCREAIVTAKWVDEQPQDCDGCELGSVTAFFASESGLTRWRQYSLLSAHAPPPLGSEWARGPSEEWYKRAVAMPERLVVHAPVTPVRKMRRTEDKPPALKTRHKWLTAARIVEHPDKGMIGVAGYHFHPLHLRDVLKAVTYDDDTLCNEHCQQSCDGEDWECVLVDEGGWLVAGHHPDEEELTEQDPATQHLANIHPHAMAALLEAKVFEVHLVHDYQGVCFPLKDPPEAGSAVTIIPSILKLIWHSVNVILSVTKEMVTILALISCGGLVASETAKEKQLRSNATRRNYEREKFDRLYDPRVLINQTVFAACDRSRPLYQLQRGRVALEAWRREPSCSWPLVGAEVPKTNLVLLAIYKLCPPYTGPLPPDPFVNKPENTMSNDWPSELACSRNRVPLPARAPHLTCFPHEYAQEAGYRQCEPWLPDPEVQDTAPSIFPSKVSTYILTFLVIAFFIFSQQLTTAKAQHCK